jgi:hypothetical protein
MERVTACDETREIVYFGVELVLGDDLLVGSSTVVM